MNVDELYVAESLILNLNFLVLLVIFGKTMAFF